MAVFKNYTAKKRQLQQAFEKLGSSNAPAVTLAKNTSNLFRVRLSPPAARLDVKAFNQVLRINKANLTAEVEGMTTFEALVDATLERGLVPLVVPQLKSITIGGAVSGLGIESSSWRYGLVHESVLEMEVLTGDGRVVVCTADNEHSELFYALPNSYGSLGYILKLKIRLRPVKPYIKLTHLSFIDRQKFFSKLGSVCKTGKHRGLPVQFVDGTIFGPGAMYLTLGSETDDAPYTSDYTYMNIYYRSIGERKEDYLTIRDYLWRWDTDWFWCSKNVYAQKPLVRRLLGRKYLRSTTYSQLMRLDQRYRLMERFQRLTGTHQARETIIQDIQISLAKVGQFLDFFDKQIDIKPIWVCPTCSAGSEWPYSLYPMTPGQLYINFGFWDSVPTDKDPAKGYYNRLVEQKVSELGGAKSLYADSFYARRQFEKLYNYSHYKKLKKHYDPAGRLKDFYDKCVKSG